MNAYRRPIKRVVRSAHCVVLGAVCLVSHVAIAQETTIYTYDAKGRLTGVTRSGGPSNGVSTSYQYDKADNRTNVTTTNSPNGYGSGNGGGATVPPPVYVIVPLNGFTILKIG